MWPYWLMFAMASLGVFATISNLGSGPMSSTQRFFWVLVVIIFALMIGFRHEVGGDWSSYIRHFYYIKRMTLEGALAYSDPGYYFLNWFVARVGGTVYWVNFLCTLLVIFGVSYFAKQQPLPWLALLVAVPYLLIVVAMGYSRQAAALGLALLGLSYLGKHQTVKFVCFVLLGALFHKSAILLLPIAALSASHSRMWTILWVGVVAVSGAYFLVLDSADELWRNYVEADYQSQGGVIRVAMNAVPSMVLLLYRNRLFYNQAESKLWLWMAVLSLITIPLVMISSTAVDRVALYFIPIQMFTFSRIAFLALRPRERQFLVMGVVVYYGLVQFVWLNYAAHANAWLPYQNYFFITSF